MPRNYDVIYDKEKDETIDLCLKCTAPDCTGVCVLLKCINCPHYKYFGDLSLHYCDITDKTVNTKTICPIKRGRVK